MNELEGMVNRRYEYKKVRVQDDVAVEAQNYANQGWRTVSVFREKPIIAGHISEVEVLTLLLERVNSLPLVPADESPFRVPEGG